MKLEPLGDSAVVATLGSGIDDSTLSAVAGLATALAASKAPGLLDVVPAYDTVTVFYDPLQLDSGASILMKRSVATSRPAPAGPAPGRPPTRGESRFPSPMAGNPGPTWPRWRIGPPFPSRRW